MLIFGCEHQFVLRFLQIGSLILTGRLCLLWKLQMFPYDANLCGFNKMFYEPMCVTHNTLIENWFWLVN